jgi:hypothetical protein
MQAPGFFLERRDGTVVAVSCVNWTWLAAQGIKAAQLSDLAGKVQGAIRVPGKPELKTGEFFRPSEPVARPVWAMSVGVAPKQWPAEPLKIRRQTFGLGCVGTLLCQVDGKQKGFPARIIQGVPGGDEFVLQMGAPIPAEAVMGSLFIDEFGHLVAIGAKVEKAVAARADPRVLVRGALSLKGLDR